MSQLITLDNYEEFYLDYLEGALSGELLAAFEAFLEAHPELRIDETPLPNIEAEEATFDPIRKLAMKQGIDLQDLHAETLPFFLIARQEGQLTSEQEAQLNYWLEANAHYQQDARLYALTTLQPDHTEVFTAKEGLKKPVGGRVIPLWATGLAVAAGLALFFLLNTGNNPADPGKTLNGNTVAHHNSDSVTNRKHSTDPVYTANDTPKTGSDEKSEKRKNRGKTVYPTQIRSGKEDKKETHPRRRVIQHQHIMQEGTIMASLEKRNASLSPETKNIAPLERYVVPGLTPKTTPENNDMASITVNDMKNPIEPVTSRLSQTLDTPVDFRTAKAAKRKGGGFYLKIGKLEISHQTASL